MKSPDFPSEWTISKELKPLVGIQSTWKESMRARGGTSVWRASRNDSSSVWGPSTSMSTPAEVLRTQPFNSCRVASPYTNGRNPTPWTMPVMWIRTPFKFIYLFTVGLWFAIFSPNQFSQASKPSPVRQEIGKVTKPGLSTSTPRWKYSMSKSI